METIYTAHFISTLGHVLAAATNVGLCFVGLDDCEETLLHDLKKRRPTAVLQANTALLQVTVEHLQRYLAGQPDLLDLPLDILGSPFQRQVWNALRQVPYGQVLSYAQLTHQMGLPPTSVRAVAHGCATNPAALVIPCHRILRGDGSLGGYFWGLERKRALLEMEGSLPKTPRQQPLF